MAKAKGTAENVEEKIKVELISFVKGGNHTVYHNLGETMFVDGLAEVSADVAKELQDLCLIK